MTENSERELATGVAIFMLAPLPQLADYLTGGELVANDATIVELGAVGAAEVAPEVTFTRSERTEAESLLDAAPGFRFNLSLAEIDALHAAKTANPEAAKAAPADIAEDAYRRLLQRRAQAYLRGGLSAITPYARTRDGGVTDPTPELRLAAADVQRLPAPGPELRDALLRYPAAPSLATTSRVFWLKRHVQRRPDFCLLHELVMASSSLVLHVERYFYVGHSYNAGQILTGALPYQDGTVVFSTGRMSTDEVLGIGNQVKRTIGRAQLRDEMRRRLDRLRGSQLRPPSLQNP